MSSLKMHVMLISHSIIDLIKQERTTAVARVMTPVSSAQGESSDCTNEKPCNSPNHISRSNHSN